MRWAILFELSHRIVIDRTIDTSIINTTVMLKYVLLQHGTDAACLNWHLVILRAQTLVRIELITTVHGTSTSTNMSN